jgi:short-subunit dehydrogenase
MGKVNLKDKWILVTGASSGLGRQIVDQLARRENANLIITARRRHLLTEIQENIRQRYQRKVTVIAMDLRQEGSARELFILATRDHPVFAVINNAGMTSYKPTSLENLSIYRDIFNLNYHSLMELTLYFYGYFRERGEGAILNVTSAAAFMPIPYQNVYAASKHAAQAFTEGLIAENKHKRIHISTFAPGGIATDMIKEAGLDKKYKVNSIYYMTPGTVARRAIKCLKFKRHIKIPGMGNKIVYFLTRLFPRSWVVQVASYFYKHPDIS